jgi:hypothetical protein
MAFDFGLDVVREVYTDIDPDVSASITDIDSLKTDIATHARDAMQACGIPSLPYSLDNIGYLHALSGYAMDAYLLSNV